MAALCVEMLKKQIPVSLKKLSTYHFIHTSSKPLWFRSTSLLYAEPLKKKKRIDPMILRLREERKRKRIEKQIRHLKKMQKQLKPVNELEIPPHILQEKAVRTRKKELVSSDAKDEQISLKREWAEYKSQQFLAEMSMLDRLVDTQAKALKELRLESEDLYQKAIELDPELIPFQVTGPVQTPPIANYDSPNGVFSDVTKRWDIKPDLPPLKPTFRKRK